MGRCKLIATCFTLWFLSFPTFGLADFLEVRRTANIYEQPDRKSDRVTRFVVEDHEAPFLILLEPNKSKGYYNVKVPGTSEEGWIYKTYVRRFAGPIPFPPYDRSLYKHWIDEDGNCIDTRHEVLIRDSVPGTVRMSGTNPCRVNKGTWKDPYSGETITSPSKIQIDHVVPLKNAHDSGAWAWPRDKKKEYANFLGSETHLLAVKGSENQRKGAKGPDKYLPPNTSFHCDYVGIWSEIKSDWGLDIPRTEREAIGAVLTQCP